MRLSIVYIHVHGMGRYGQLWPYIPGNAVIRCGPVDFKMGVEMPDNDIGCVPATTFPV
jgi:hypothetical protein